MTRTTHPPAPIFCFTHVQKAGGTTVEAVFRRHMGIRHMVVNPRMGWRYTEADMRTDLRLNPFARNLCSHWLRPVSRFGAFEERLVWYTMLRDPVKRYMSHYRYHVQSMGSGQSFESFLRTPIQKNLQTWLLAGEPDPEAAIQVLRSRYRCVGLLERFDESLLLLRESLGVPGLAVAYGQPHNTARDSSDTRLKEAMWRYRDDILENNRHDVALYQYAADEIFPGQVAMYGEDRLRADLATEFQQSSDSSAADRWRDRSSVAFRRGVYLPVYRIRRALARARGLPDNRH